MRRGHVYVIIAVIMAVFIVLAFVHSQVRVVSDYGTASGNLGSVVSQEGQNASGDILSGYFDSFLGRLRSLMNVNSGSIQEKPVSLPVTTGTIVTTPSAIPVPAIPVSTRVKAVGSITGGSGTNSVDIFVPSDYWELTYTVDPLDTGGQDLHSSTGSNSVVFPVFIITITDMNSGKLFDTIDISGSLDKDLWKRSDPRPWYNRYYAGNRTFRFNVTARHIISYTIEPRVPR